jgi:HAMP domain-containing protein
MKMPQVVRRSLGAQTSLKLAVLLVALTGAAAVVITVSQTRQMEALTLDKAKLAAAAGARHYGEVLETSIDDGTLSVGDVFDRSYVEIKGWEWGQQRKYHTRYDVVLDRAVLVFQDRLLDHDDFVFAVGVDENGYLPTHNTRFQAPMSGDAARDLAANRTKRIFDDPVGLAAAKSTAPSLVQVYHRDTGETMWDVSAPIWVKGKHWGGFRIAVSMDRIAARQRQLFLSLLGVFALFTVGTVTAMYLLVRAAMKPVVALTAAADRISLGEELETPLRSDAIDEIGQLTKTIDRLRVSMKGALSRLGQ